MRFLKEYSISATIGLDKCRGCLGLNLETFINLGSTPIANDFSKTLESQETKAYPLHARVCMDCGFVQVEPVLSRENIFSPEYVYFSSYSQSWLHHSKSFADKVVTKFELQPKDLVLEIASNDGYLLQYFKEKGMETLGVEPTAGTARIANEKGIDTIVEFFGRELAAKLEKKVFPKLICAINVLAHVPDIHDFIEGFSIMCKDDCVLMFEFPHLLSTIKENQFDTIYHEHYSYLNLSALIPIFTKYNLRVFDVEKITTHGGSVRVYCCTINAKYDNSNSLNNILDEESMFDPKSQKNRKIFQDTSETIRLNLRNEISIINSNGSKIVAYGAAAKGNTLLNFCGLSSKEIPYVIDLNPNKEGKFLPGSRIPVVGLKELISYEPDFILVLPWNLSNEIKNQLMNLNLKAKIFTAVPEIKYL